VMGGRPRSIGWFLGPADFRTIQWAIRKPIRLNLLLPLGRSMIEPPQSQVVAVSNTQFTANFSTFEAAIADRYVVEEEIGRGNRATVYRGRDVRSGEPAAIKVLRAGPASALVSGRFVKQMRKAADIRHPGIVSFLDVGDAAGRM